MNRAEYYSIENCWITICSIFGKINIASLKWGKYKKCKVTIFGLWQFIAFQFSAAWSSACLPRCFQGFWLLKPTGNAEISASKKKKSAKIYCKVSSFPQQFVAPGSTWDQEANLWKGSKGGKGQGDWKETGFDHWLGRFGISAVGWSITRIPPDQEGIFTFPVLVWRKIGSARNLQLHLSIWKLGPQICCWLAIITFLWLSVMEVKWIMRTSLHFLNGQSNGQSQRK